MSEKTEVTTDVQTTDTDDDFAAGWMDPEFKDEPEPASEPAEPVTPKEEDPPEEPAKEEEPPAETEGDDPPAEPGEEEEPPEEPVTPKEEEPPAEPAKDTALDTILKRVDEVNTKLDATRQPRAAYTTETAPAKDKPGPSKDRIDPADFKGDKLESKLKKLREADPDLADVVKDLIEPLAGGLQAAYDESDNTRVSAAKQDLVQKAQAVEDAVTAKHGDWRKTIAGDDFLGWLAKQPTYLQRITQTTEDPQEFIEILDLHKAASAPASAKKDDDPPPKEEDDAENQARLDAAREPRTRVASERQTPKNTRSATDDFSSGWMDPEFKDDGPQTN